MSEADGITSTLNLNRFVTHPSINILTLTLCFLVMAVQAVVFQIALHHPNHLVLTDFNDYYIVGRMVVRGDGLLAYSWPSLKSEMIHQTGTFAFMPWAYPPQFMPFTAILGLIPISAAYLAFSLSTFFLFYSSLRRLTGAYAGSL